MVVVTSRVGMWCLCVCNFDLEKNMHSKWKSLVIEMDEFTQNITEISPESGDLCNAVGDNHHQKPLDAFLWTQTTVWLSVYFLLKGTWGVSFIIIFIKCLRFWFPSSLVHISASAWRLSDLIEYIYMCIYIHTILCFMCSTFFHVRCVP